MIAKITFREGQVWAWKIDDINHSTVLLLINQLKCNDVGGG